MKIAFLLISLLATPAAGHGGRGGRKRAGDHGGRKHADGRKHGGGRGGRRGHGGRGRKKGPRPIPNDEYTCSTQVPCNLKVFGSPGEALIDGGIRICRQHPFDDTRNRTFCVENTNPIVGFDTDECGCCDGPCLDTECRTCECQKMDRDGNVLYQGYEMEMTRRARSGGTRTKTVCVAADFTVDAQIHGGTCVTKCTDSF